MQYLVSSKNFKKLVLLKEASVIAEMNYKSLYNYSNPELKSKTTEIIRLRNQAFGNLILKYKKVLLSYLNLISAGIRQ